MLQRYHHGEFFAQDSIQHTGPAFHTSIGRTVYGGGGITPDVFIPEDTLNMTSYYKEAVMSGLVLQYAFHYTDENRQLLKKYTDMSSLVSYLKRQGLVERFATYANQHGLQRRNLMIQKSYRLLDRFLTSRIVYNILNEAAWSEYLNQDDPTVKAALEILKKKEAFPQKPVQKKEQSRKVASGGKPFWNRMLVAFGRKE